MAKQKQKTRKSVVKRIKLTKNGVKRAKSCKNHRITGKKKTVREDKKGLMVSKTLLSFIKRAVPGLKK